MVVPLAAAPSSRPTASSQMLDEDRNAVAALIAALAKPSLGPAHRRPVARDGQRARGEHEHRDRQLLDSLRALDRYPRGRRRSLRGDRSGGDAPRRAAPTSSPPSCERAATRSRPALAPVAARRADLDRRRAARRPGPAGPSRRRRRPARASRRPADADRPGVHAHPPGAARRPATSPCRARRSSTVGSSQHFDEPGDPVLAATHLLADLSQLYFDSPSVERGTVVAPPDRTGRPRPRSSTRSSTGSSASPMLTPVTIDDYFRTVPARRRRRRSPGRRARSPSRRPRRSARTAPHSAHPATSRRGSRR